MALFAAYRAALMVRGVGWRHGVLSGGGRVMDGAGGSAQTRRKS